MTWNRQLYLLQPGDSDTPLGDRLTALGFSPHAPARTIIKQPNDLEGLFRYPGTSDTLLLKKMMRNFWEYGRSNWSWTASSKGAALNGGLVKGDVNWGACGVFNDNFAYVATEVLGISGITKGNKGPVGTTWFKGSFVTMPCEVIDSKWRGNVMSHNYSYNALQMFKFTDHYFCNYNGLIFDATSNTTHENTSTMVAFELDTLPPDEVAKYNAELGQAYLVKNVSEHFVARPDLDLRQGRWVLAALGFDRLNVGGANRAFNKYILTKQSSMGRSEIENFSLVSGRTSNLGY